MTISGNSIQLNVTDTGAGEAALVFQHHCGGSSLTWSEVSSSLLDRFSCVAIDARGAGNSEARANGYGTEDHAAHALRVVRSLGLTKHILVGHSMGGKASQLLAANRLPGLLGLVLIASSPLTPMVIEQVRREQMKAAYVNRYAVAWTHENVLLGSAISAASREQLTADALRLSLEATAGWIEIGFLEDFSNKAEAIDVPVAILSGELDRVDAHSRGSVAYCSAQSFGRGALSSKQSAFIAGRSCTGGRDHNPVCG